MPPQAVLFDDGAFDEALSVQPPADELALCGELTLCGGVVAWPVPEPLASLPAGPEPAAPVLDVVLAAKFTVLAVLAATDGGPGCALLVDAALAGALEP